MNATSIQLKDDVNVTQQPQPQLLLLARRLDTIGRRTEQFLCQQLDQLERAIEEFECEKAAWRRQLRRESHELARQRDEVQQLLETNVSGSPLAVDVGRVSARMKRDIADAEARKSTVAPLRLLIQPGSATTMQIGLLMFEMSKLNRDLGGRGLRYEIDDVRIPKKRLLARMTRSDCDEEILELTAFPKLPLAGRGTHVALDIDLTDRLEDWIMFKSRLLQSSLVNTDLEQVFRSGKSVKHHRQSSCVVKEATYCANGSRPQSVNPSDYPCATWWANTSVDAIQQQVARLENCYKQLSIESGLFIHVELHSLTKDESEK